MRAADATAMTMLEDLQWHSGKTCLNTGAAGHWIAQRRRNGRTMVGGGPDGLRGLIIEDYRTEPVARGAAS
jgi:hypothetical protein